MASPSLTCYPPLSIFYTISLLLQDVKTYFCSPLCRFAMPTPTPILRSASPPLSLTSLPVLLATSLQQDVCRRLILGYNRWYFLPLLTSFHTHVTFSIPFLQCHVHFANFVELCGGARVIFFSLFITRGLAELLFRVRQSRRLHDRPGRRWQVTRFCIPHV